jgi:hypothetical protein
MFSRLFHGFRPRVTAVCYVTSLAFPAAKKENNHLVKSQFADKMVVIRFNIPIELKGLSPI